MLSAIGRATARQARVAGRLSIRTQLTTPRAAPVIPSGIRVAAVFARGFAEAGAPKKTTKTATKTAAAKTKAAVAKKAAKQKKVLTEEEKTRLKIRDLKKTALLKEEPVNLPVASWTAFMSKRMKGAMDRDPKPTFTEAVRELSEEFKNLPEAEKEVRRTGKNQPCVHAPSLAELPTNKARGNRNWMMSARRTASPTRSP
jgi:hypothetical protein